MENYVFKIYHYFFSENKIGGFYLIYTLYNNSITDENDLRAIGNMMVKL